VKRRGRAVRRPRWMLAGLLLAVALPVQAAVTVNIKGVEGDIQDNVRSFLSIAQQDVDTQDAARVRRLHGRAEQEIRKALVPFGYYEPRVRGRLESTEDGWVATYVIRPGPRVRVTRVDIRFLGAAADDPAFGDLVAELPLKEDQPLRHSDYDTARQRIMELAAERGYVEAQWRTHTLRIDPEKQEAHATLVLDSGPRYRFGEVTFAQNRLSERFLRRYLRFKPGDPFLAGKLLELRYALDDSDYFRRVDVRARRDQARDQRIPVDVDLEPKPKHRYTFGIGYGTDTGGRFSLGRHTRYVNRSGHTLEAQLQLAEISSRLSARYTIPLEQPWRERLELDTAISEEDIGGGISRRLGLGARRVTQSGGWQRSFSLQFERSVDTIAGETTDRNLVMPGLGLARSRFDDPVYASRGYRVGIDLNGGTETFGSDVSFLRLHASARGVHRVWKGGRVLARGEAGRVWVDNVDDLPLSQRFFAGGDQSVRGFEYQELGPRDENGKVVGGSYLAVASLELEQLVVGNWGAAVFVDHGNAMNDPSTPLRTSVGVGLRYRSPVGVFRVDVAQPTEGDETPRLHLSLEVDL